MPDAKDNKLEHVLNENCLINGKERKRGEVIKPNEDNEQMIEDLQAAGRFCKSTDECEGAKKSIVESKKENKG